MSRIIAIEADPKRRRLLATLIREHVKAELKFADSARAAIALIDEKIPELVVASALLSPIDESTLMHHIKSLESAPYVQLLTVPALDMLADSPREEPRRIRRWFSRRAPDAPRFDRAMLGAQIADGLDRARAARKEYAIQLAHRAEIEEIARRRGTALSVITSVGTDLRTATGDEVRRATAALRGPGSDERRTATRRRQDDLPWLSQLKLGTGSEVSLVNISSTGVLFESGSKFLPGSMSELHLSGDGTSMVVPVRFIRSEISRIDALGVKYQAAAAFDKEIDLTGPGRNGAQAATPPTALAQLLAKALTETAAGEPPYVRFVLGVREMVGARDVQVRPNGSRTGGRETLYFDIPGDDRARMLLQVRFARARDVTEGEFKLLKAAAWLTAAALEFDTVDQPASKPMLMLEEAVA